MADLNSLAIPAVSKSSIPGKVSEVSAQKT